MSSSRNSGNLNTPNKHWPSLFRAKQHPSSSSGQKSGSEAKAHEERNPEPKPRWNPRPDQIRILESIFNSGVVNPPRDEIRKIRMQLQEYGPVGDANVFYWFQNRKSRSKQKLQRTAKAQAQGQVQSDKLSATTTANSASADPSKNLFSSSSASSSSAANANTTGPAPTLPFYEYLGQPSASVMVPQTTPSTMTSYHPLHAVAAGGMSFGGIGMNMETGTASANEGGSTGSGTITVMINGITMEVPAGPLNIWSIFGERVLLLNSSGQPIMMNEAGSTLHGLQHGGAYLLMEWPANV